MEEGEENLVEGGLKVVVTEVKEGEMEVAEVAYQAEVAGMSKAQEG